MYKDIQMVFQMPQDSFDPRRTLRQSIAESMLNFGHTKKEANERVDELLELVSLKKEFANRLPHEVSGGQAHRDAIARAIAINPKIIILDEATSALDVSVQAQIVELLLKLKEQLDMCFLFICHDLALVWAVCDRVQVMHKGSIVECGKTKDVIKHSAHPYTKLLLNSVFPTSLDDDFSLPTMTERDIIGNDGCKFAYRCPKCTDICINSIPPEKTIRTDNTDLISEHKVSCFYEDRTND